MTEKKYCYRYVDGNDSKGRPIVMLWKRVILRETEKTFWHAHDFRSMSLDSVLQHYSRPSNKQVKRCLKNAARSGYHLTKEQAMQAFIYRKVYQLAKIKLTAETVQMCLQGLNDSGFIDGQVDCGTWLWGKVINVPEGEFLAAESAGPVASTFSWGEY